MRLTQTFTAAAAFGLCVLGPSATSAFGDKLINTPWYRQPTNWSCGPTSGQIIIRALTGRYYDMWTVNTIVRATSWGGCNTPDIVRGVRHFTGQSYNTVYNFNRSLVVSNIDRNAPVEINFRGDYMSYIRQYLMHHSVIVGYTGGGFYIHDTAFGANKWASNTSVWNAVQYHYKIYAVKYTTISGTTSGGTTTPAASYVMYRVKLQSNLNVRSSPSTTGTRVGTLASGTVVDVYGIASNGWYKIVYGGGWRYIINQYSVKIGQSVQATSNLNVRTGPGTGYAKVGMLNANSIIHAWATSNGWYKVYYNGAWRWILALYTKKA